MLRYNGDGCNVFEHALEGSAEERNIITIVIEIERWKKGVVNIIRSYYHKMDGLLKDLN